MDDDTRRQDETIPEITAVYRMKRLLSPCKLCNNTGWYHYDHNHKTVCSLCCKHNEGFWQLKNHYGINNERWCCLAGCGFIISFNPDNFLKD